MARAPHRQKARAVQLARKPPAYDVALTDQGVLVRESHGLRTTDNQGPGSRAETKYVMGVLKGIAAQIYQGSLLRI